MTSDEFNLNEQVKLLYNELERVKNVLEVYKKAIKLLADNYCAQIDCNYCVNRNCQYKRLGLTRGDGIVDTILEQVENQRGQDL